MSVIFFVSSAGDTDLAKETINQMREQGFEQNIYLVPLTVAATDRTANMKNTNNFTCESLSTIQSTYGTINSFIKKSEIKRAYIGVSSGIDEQTPFQIAKSLDIPHTMVYEYMFKPEPHALWNYAADLASDQNCDFAVPFPLAAEDIRAVNADAKIHEVGHLSIDRVMKANPVDASSTKAALLIKESEELAFISGTTQPTAVDKEFLEALLTELATGNYPNLQIRFGVHPSVSDPDAYLDALLNVCAKYPEIHSQFKIILTPQLEEKLKHVNVQGHPIILRCQVSGPMATNAADKIAQAVPGALLNESVFKKPCYSHNQAKSYLPKKWFASDIPSFFNVKSQKQRTPEKLKWSEPASTQMARLMMCP